MIISFKNWIAEFLIIFLYVIGFKFSFGLDLSIVAALIILAITFVSGLGGVYSRKSLTSTYLILFLPILLMLSITYNNITGEAGTFIIKICLYTLSSFFLSLYLIRHLGANAFDIFLYSIFVSVFFNSLIIITQFLLPSFRELVYSYSSVSDLMFTEVGRYRMAGLSGGGGALLSYFSAIGFLCGLTLFKNKVISNYLFYGIGLVIFLSCFFTGRTGVIIIVVFGALMFSENLSSFIKNILIPTFFVCLTLLIFVNLHSVFDSSFAIAVNRTFSEFLSDEQSERFRTFKTLYDMFFIPDLLGLQFYFGTGNTGRTVSNYLYSDVGYIRMFYLGGLLFFTWFIVVVIINALFVWSAQFKYKKEVSVILMSVFFVEIKEMVLLGRHVLPFILTLLFLCLNERINEK